MFEPALTEILPPFDSIAAGETNTSPPRTDDPFWAKVIGGSYRPSGAGIPVRHLHPLHVQPIFESVAGTPAADVMAGLMFRNMLTWNNAQHAWDLARSLERERDELLGRLRDAEAALDEARKAAG